MKPLFVLVLLLQSCLSLDTNEDEEFGLPLSQAEFEEARNMTFDEDERGAMEIILAANAEYEEKAMKKGLHLKHLTMGDIVPTSEHVYRVWPSTTIPYTISPKFTPKQRKVLAACFDSFEELVGIRLVPRRYQRDYIHFFKDDGCFSKLGYQGGQQKISLADNCVYLKTCQHEIMHALGVSHEQCRPDRDNFVTIKHENIRPDRKGNFDIAYFSKMFGTYDFCSIMHYTLNAFSKNGKPTIEVKGDPNKLPCVPGLVHSFSPLDIYGLRQMYRIP